MNPINIQIPALNNEQPKTFMQFGSEILPALTTHFPIENFHTKTIATLIGMIAENNKHNGNNPINITVNTNNNDLSIIAEDNGPGFQAPILHSIKKEFTTSMNSKGKGLFALLIMVISCNGCLIIQSKKLKERYSFQNVKETIKNQIMIDKLISAINLPFNYENICGLTIEIVIPIKSITKKTAHLNLDKYITW